MQLAQKATLGFALLAGLSLAAVQPAAASHEQFQNVMLNGVALTPTQDTQDSVAVINTFTLVDNVFTITTDYHSNDDGNEYDNLNFVLTQTGGTSLTPDAISPSIMFSPDMQTMTETFNLTGTFQGNLHMGTNYSDPDYSSPAFGYNFQGADFNLDLTPGASAPAPAAVPEPSSVASMGLGAVGLLGLVLRARKGKAKHLSA